MATPSRHYGPSPVSANVLSGDYISKCGVAVTPPLKAWLTRAAFIARTRSSVSERERYERWALCTVEAAAATAGGTASFPWAKTSPVMPTDAPDRVPNLRVATAPQVAPSGQLAHTARNLPNAAFVVVSPPATTVPATSPPVVPDVQQTLSEECLRRAPAGLRPFVQQALAERDAGAVTGVPSSPCSLLDILARATELQQLNERAHHASVGYLPENRSDTVPTAITVEPPAVSRPTKRQRQTSPANRKEREMSSTNASETSQFFALLLTGDEAPGASAGTALGHSTVVGTSTAMERLYSRYEPVAEDIRSPVVLHRAFEHVELEAASRERREGRPSALDYLNDQLKGMRQDLRVQNIISNFAVSVYERHATVALERGDIGEFNQCQSALKSLYASTTVDKKQCRVAEFFYYRLVYLSLSRQYDALSTELITYTNASHRPKGDRGVADFTSRKRIRSCLQLCGACEDGDIATMCRALSTFDVAMAHLVQIYLPRLRVTWIEALLRAVKGGVPLTFLMLHLGFVGFSSRHSRSNSSDANTFWLDGSKEAAAAQFTELFERLKINVPSHFSFTQSLQEEQKLRTDDNWNNPCLAVLDAATAYSAVQAYLSYLTARRDVSLQA